MIQHPLSMFDLTGRQAAERERTFLLRQPVEQRKHPLAAAFFEANHHETDINRQV